jgi:hypothetical protein
MNGSDQLIRNPNKSLLPSTPEGRDPGPTKQTPWQTGRVRNVCSAPAYHHTSLRPWLRTQRARGRNRAVGVRTRRRLGGAQHGRGVLFVGEKEKKNRAQAVPPGVRSADKRGPRVTLPAEHITLSPHTSHELPPARELERPRPPPGAAAMAVPLLLLLLLAMFTGSGERPGSAASSPRSIVWAVLCLFDRFGFYPRSWLLFRIFAPWGARGDGTLCI